MASGGPLGAAAGEPLVGRQGPVNAPLDAGNALRPGRAGRGALPPTQYATLPRRWRLCVAPGGGSAEPPQAPARPAGPHRHQLWRLPRYSRRQAAGAGGRGLRGHEGDITGVIGPAARSSRWSKVSCYSPPVADATSSRPTHGFGHHAEHIIDTLPLTIGHDVFTTESRVTARPAGSVGAAQDGSTARARRAIGARRPMGRLAHPSGPRGLNSSFWKPNPSACLMPRCSL